MQINNQHDYTLNVEIINHSKEWCIKVSKEEKVFAWQLLFMCMRVYKFFGSRSRSRHHHLFHWWDINLTHISKFCFAWISRQLLSTTDKELSLSLSLATIDIYTREWDDAFFSQTQKFFTLNLLHRHQSSYQKRISCVCSVFNAAIVKYYYYSNTWILMNSLIINSFSFSY